MNDHSSSVFVLTSKEITAPLIWPKAKSTLTDRFVTPTKLGSGGFGQVYRVADSWLSMNVAVKISFAQDSLVNEVQRLRALPKQYFVQTFDYGRQKDYAYYAMELLVAREKWFSLDRFHSVMEKSCIRDRERALYALFIIQHICYGLTYLHNGDTGDQYFHGDLKPANIFFNLGALDAWKYGSGHDDAPIVKIIDLGVSGKVGEAAAGFTRSYAAPEQAAGRPCGETVDTYSVGRILLKLLDETVDKTIGTRVGKRLQACLGKALSTDVVHLLRGSLQSRPATRFSCESIGDFLFELFSRDYHPPAWGIIADLSNDQREMSRLELAKTVVAHIMHSTGRVRTSKSLREQAQSYIDNAITDRLICRASRGHLRLAD